MFRKMSFTLVLGLAAAAFAACGVRQAQARPVARMPLPAAEADDLARECYQEAWRRGFRGLESDAYRNELLRLYFLMPAREFGDPAQTLFCTNGCDTEPGSC